MQLLTTDPLPLLSSFSFSLFVGPTAALTPTRYAISLMMYICSLRVKDGKFEVHYTAVHYKPDYTYLLNLSCGQNSDRLYTRARRG